MLLLNLFIFILALLAYYRAPRWQLITPLWFFISWLPAELPWAFGVLQILVVTLLLLLKQSWSVADAFGCAVVIPSLYLWFRLHQKTLTARAALSLALSQLGSTGSVENDLCINLHSIIAKRDWLKPFSYRRNGVKCIQDVAYGEHPRQVLDIYQPLLSESTFGDVIKRPVLLHVHGGAWMIGHKKQQAQPLIHYLVQQGWLCVDINYRLAPKDRFPSCVIDVKTAIVWLKNNIANYGGDPEFIAITGGSAGGHLCALAALTANQPAFQPGFEECDTHVQAAVPLYGIYNFINSNKTRDGAALERFLYRYVMPCSPSEDLEYWRKSSPLYQINENAPPMFVLQGTHDCLAWVEGARAFVTQLKEKSNAPVVYSELDGAQHAFDLFHGVRAEFTIAAIGIFLRHCYGDKIHKI